MTGSPLRRLQELAAQLTWVVISGWRATKEANLAGACQSAIKHGGQVGGTHHRPNQRTRRKR